MTCIPHAVKYTRFCRECHLERTSKVVLSKHTTGFSIENSYLNVFYKKCKSVHMYFDVEVSEGIILLYLTQNSFSMCSRFSCTSATYCSRV